MNAANATLTEYITQSYGLDPMCNGDVVMVAQWAAKNLVDAGQDASVVKKQYSTLMRKRHKVGLYNNICPYGHPCF